VAVAALIALPMDGASVQGQSQGRGSEAAGAGEGGFGGGSDRGQRGGAGGAGGRGTDSILSGEEEEEDRPTGPASAVANRIAVPTRRSGRARRAQGRTPRP
jgi:hypothetical protein